MVNHDLGCNNPACTGPTLLEDVKAERGADGKIVMRGPDGKNVVGPACEGCGTGLSFVFKQLNIGGRVQTAIGETEKDKQTAPRCDEYIETALCSAISAIGGRVVARHKSGHSGMLVVDIDKGKSN